MSQDSGNAVQEIREQIDGELIVNAESEGLDVDELIAEKAQEHSNYGPSTVARFAESAIRKVYEAEKADELNGIIMGSRDRYGRNWPRRHSLVRSSGDHLEISTWDGSLPNPQGDDVAIPTGGAIVSMRCEYDDEYNSWQGARIESVTSLSHEEVVEEVGEIAVSPDALSRDDEYNVVVVKGKIAFVNPQTLFEDGEPQDDGPVLMTDERGEAQPHFEIALDEVGQTRTRLHLERQAYARPYFEVPDLAQLCNDASELETPDKQASFLQDGLRGVEVIAVGNVSNYDTQRADGGKTEYVDIGLTALVAVDTETDDSAAMPEPEEEPEPESEPEADTTDDADDDADDDDTEASGEVAEMAENIEQYAGLVGEDPADMTVEQVIESLSPDVEDVVIRQALKQLSGDADSGGAGGSDTGDDPVESLRQAGAYHCPMDGCAFSAGSKGGLFGHIDSESDHAGPDQNAEEWIEQQVN